MFSPRLGRGLIRQRASLRLRVLSGQQRGFPVEKTPENLLLEGKLKASAGLAPGPRSGGAKAPAGPGSLEHRTHLRHPGNSPAPLPALRARPRCLTHPGFAHGRELPVRGARSRRHLRVAWGPAPERRPRHRGSFPPPRGSLTS